MRVRKKKNSDRRFRACSQLMTDDPAADFGIASDGSSLTGRRLFAEIGCGKGRFIVETASANPDDDFIALEKIDDVLTIAMERVKDNPPKNVRFICADVSALQDMLPPGSLDGIYLNFSDPWPKARHEKRRLTYRDFLALYRRLLKADGAIYMKTDNRALFDFSLESFEQNGYRAEDVTFDLHRSQWNEGNIRTEYEDNFSAKGFPICRGVFRPVGATGAAAPAAVITANGYRDGAEHDTEDGEGIGKED